MSKPVMRGISVSGDREIPFHRDHKQKSPDLFFGWARRLDVSTNSQGGKWVLEDWKRNMNSNSEEGYRNELVSLLSNAVKQVQMDQMSKEELDGLGPVESFVTNDSPSGRILFARLEMIFMHGLKNKGHGIWEPIQYFCRSDVVRKIQRLRYVLTNVGRGRAWIYLALNEKELEGYLQSFQMDLDHMHKYYHRSAMICSNQVSILQTLIAGLDFITFKLNLDVAYLDFSIKCHKNWLASKPPIQKLDRGSVVHIDTRSITRTGQKAVGFMKGILSHENTTREKSMKNVNTRTLVAVNNLHHAPMQMKRYCPDCHTQSELVCFCVRESSSTLTASAPSANVKLLEDVLCNRENGFDQSDTSSLSCEVDTDSSVPYVKQRINPFNRNLEESDAKFTSRRCNPEFLLVDAPVEVIRQRTRKRKKFSDSASISSTRSEDLAHTIAGLTDVPSRHGSISDASLSDPLIGFDPQKDTVKHVVDGDTNSYSFDSMPLNVTHNAPDITYSSEGVIDTVEFITASSGGVNEKCHLQLTQTNSPDSVVVPSQDSLTNFTLEFSAEKPDSPLIEDKGNYQESMEVTETLENLQDTTLDGNENNVKTTQDNFAEVDAKNLKDNVAEQMDYPPTATPENGPKLVRSEISDERASSGENEEKEPSNGKIITAESRDVSQNATTTDVRVTKSFSHLPSEKSGSTTKLNKSDTRPPSEMSLEERQIVRRAKGMRRYRSESEQLLNALTQKEVERLRAEIQTKLKPSRDRLEKVRKSISEKRQYEEGYGSLRHDSSFMLAKEDSGTSSSSRPLFDDSSDELTSSFSQDTDPDVSSRGRESSSLHSASLSSLSATFSTFKISTPVSAEPSLNHKAIDNTLRLYLMLEILANESEEIIKLFHVSTGHSEGNWTALYLLFTDSYLYFLRSGDGNCPYRTEHIVSYEDLDYTSVGYNDQTIQFAFYTHVQKSSSKGSKGVRGRVRTKLIIDTAGKDLTDVLIATLSKAVSAYVRRQSVLIKLCPPVFHDAREHQISLIKYLRFEGLTGDIQFYQLVHWEDPDFVTGANTTKVSLEGTLKYKAQTFWGSSWKPAYFVLSGGILYQYNTKNREKPEASFELTGNNCVGCKRIRSGSSATSSLEFEVNFKDESKLELCGYSDIEITEWLQCLCMIVSLDQSSTIDREASTDGMVMNMLNHDALVPCSLIVADETLLLCHEDQHTGFCRTLAKAQRQDITTINIDREKSFVCEIIVETSSEKPQRSKWGIFFPIRGPLEAFLAVINSFSKAPALNDKGEYSSLAHYLEARTLLDSRWTRTDNLLQGRSGSVENYTFL